MSRGLSIAVATGAVIAGGLSIGHAAASPAEPLRATPGAGTVGDPLFPGLGNGGYDVQSYDLDLDYFSKSRRLSGTAVVSARSTQDLSRFSLDFRNEMEVSRVTVDGAAAGWRRTRSKLIVRPAAPIAANTGFDVAITYGGIPGVGRIPVPGGHGPPIGWVAKKRGAWVANEPDGASRWFPANDHPSDKATFSLSVEVPDGLAAVSNGELVGKDDDGSRTTWHWRMDQPMATYLLTATIGDFKLDRSPLAGIPSIVAFDRSIPGAPEDQIREFQPPPLRAFTSRIAPYPFASTGAIVADGPALATYYLETQSRPLYNAHAPRGRDAYINSGPIAHETAHQWFGDSVTPSSWKDIWLNEGIASWMEWFSESETFGGGDETLEEYFDFYYRKAPKQMTKEQLDEYWNPPPGRIERPRQMFSSSVYRRGAMTIQALYDEIGRDDLLELLRRWVTDHRYGNASTRQFIALAEEVSGADLGRFFRVWLKKPGTPRGWSESKPSGHGSRARRLAGPSCAWGGEAALNDANLYC